LTLKKDSESIRIRTLESPSVYLGDGVFELSFVDAATGLMVQSLTAGVPFVFPGGGVNAFKVRGIELSAGLDPTDVTAFMTTVTFVDGGCLQAP